MLQQSQLSRRSAPPFLATPMVEHSLTLLRDWALSAETCWSSAPGRPDHGIYGTGYNGWGVQTQQKYLAALATLATRGAGIDNVNTSWALDRALAALRFNLDSHKNGSSACTDQTQWGHTWISALGIERMMFGVHLLQPHFTDRDHAALKSVLTSEADWLLTSYQRGSHAGITCTKWAVDGGNDPESNIWNGALLWRAAVSYPDHPHAADWAERAHVFLINGVSIEADAADARIVAGKPVRDRHIGPNFFPNYALDHHAYLNVGYMIICASNAALLHFDLRAANLPRPESLDLHQADLWRVLRRFIFADGRLARIGGDTRVRYAYCQEYLLPALLYAADHLGDPAAVDLVPRQLALIQKETDYSGDGSFYSRRLAHLRRASPLYYTRLESDRACALAMVAAYAPLLKQPEAVSPPSVLPADLHGGWSEPEHGAAVHRSATRFASFAWRAFDLAQGLCLPPDDGHLAEWEHNLGGIVEFNHHPHPHHHEVKRHRRLDGYQVDSFAGGFLTWGSVIEGTDLILAESWSGTDSARHQIVFAALPDNHTVVGLNHCRMGPRRGYVSTIKALNYVLPNDLYNDHRRVLVSASGETALTSPAADEEFVSLKSPWANLENRIGLVGLYGTDTLTVDRHPARRAGVLASLHTEEIGFPARLGPQKFEAGETILDSGWAVIASQDSAGTRAFSDAHRAAVVDTGLTDVRAVKVRGQDDASYLLIANFSAAAVSLTPSALLPGARRVINLVTNTDATSALSLASGEAVLLRES